MPDNFFNMRRLASTAKTRSLADQLKELGERDPDHRPSRTPMVIEDEGKILRFRLDVVGLGVMEMVVDGDPKTGKLIYKGMKLCPRAK